MFTFSRKDGRLDAALKDLVGEQNYEAELFIQPVGSSYTVKGKSLFVGADLCSKCGWETVFELSGKIDEFLVIEKERGRSSHSPHGSQSLELDREGPETTYLTSSLLDLGELLHEQFALLWPDYPRCADEQGCSVRCKELEVVLEKESVDLSPEGGHPAFQVLSKLKGKH